MKNIEVFLKELNQIVSENKNNNLLAENKALKEENQKLTNAIKLVLADRPSYHIFITKKENQLFFDETILVIDSMGLSLYKANCSNRLLSINELDKYFSDSKNEK